MSLNKRLLHQFEHCLNCNTALDKTHFFCPKCGQKRTTGRISFRQLLLQFFEDTINWDARLFKTIRALFIPGKLTEEFFLGRQVPYWQPLRLFLFLAALQMIVVNASLDNVNEKIQKSSERYKETAHEYLVLKKMDSLKNSVASGFSNKSLAIAAMDSLTTAYIYPERFKQNRLSKKLLDAKIDSFKRAFIKEIESEGETIDSAELAEEVEDFKAQLISISNKMDDKSEDLTSEYVTVPMVSSGTRSWQKTDNQATENAAPYSLKDSSNLKIKMGFKSEASLKITKQDFLYLPLDSIIKKYGVEGTANKIMAKQSIKVMREGKSIIEFFIGRLSWMLIIMMPVFALFLELVNRKYYYVEHVIFSFHCHAMLFLLITLIFFFNHEIIPELTSIHSVLNIAVLVYLLYYFYKAMRRVYKQGRLITSFKYVFLVFSYFITMFFALLITFLVSFIFF
jgi:hypothetical protein